MWGDETAIIRQCNGLRNDSYAFPCMAYKPADWKLHKNAIITGMTDPKPKLRWFQYSLRTLLIVVALWAIACSCFASWFAVTMFAHHKIGKAGF